MTSEILSGLAGWALSLAFAYIPGLRVWFYGDENDAARPGLTPDQRRAAMGVLLILVAGAVFGLSCAGVTVDPFNSPLLSDAPAAAGACGRAGALDLVSNLLWALVANQALYPILPKRSA